MCRMKNVILKQNFAFTYWIADAREDEFCPEKIYFIKMQKNYIIRLSIVTMNSKIAP